MPSDSKGFRLRPFFVAHDQCAMKVGTDAVLLGAWAQGGKKILDVGTGSGILAMMMAHRWPEATIEAVELDSAAAHQAQQNVEEAGLSPRICVRQVDAREWMNEPPMNFDAVVCNPPFFIRALTSPQAQRTMARHADTLLPEQVVQLAARHLTAEGQLSVVIPAEMVHSWITAATMEGMMLTRKTLLRTTFRKPFRRALLAFAKERKGPMLTEEQTLLTSEGKRGAWYERLCQDFYLPQ